MTDRQTDGHRVIAIALLVSPVELKTTKQLPAKVSKPKKKSDLSKESTPDMSEFMKIMCTNFDSLRLDFSTQMSQLEKNIETKITKKISTLIDKKLTEKVEVIRHDLKNEVKTQVEGVRK